MRIRQSLVLAVLLALAVDADLVNVNATVGIGGAASPSSATTKAALTPDANAASAAAGLHEEASGQTLAAIQSKTVSTLESKTKSGLTTALRNQLAGGKQFSMKEIFSMAFKFYSGKFTPSEHRTWETSDLYSSVFMPNFGFAVLLTTYQMVEAIKSGSELKFCESPTVPSGFDLVTRAFNPALDQEFPDMGTYTPVHVHVETKETNNGGHRTVTYLKPYVRGVTAKEDGFIAWMMHSGSVVNEFESFERAELLVGINCHSFSDHADNRTQDIKEQHYLNNVQDYVEDEGGEELGSLQAHRVFFTSLKQKEGYIWCRNPMKDKHTVYLGTDYTMDPTGTLSEGDKLLENRGKVGTCDQNGMANLHDYFLDTSYSVQIEYEDALAAAGKNRFEPLKYPFRPEGRDYLQLHWKPDTKGKMMGYIAGFLIFMGGVMPAFINVVSANTETFDIEKLAKIPGILLFQFTGGLFLSAIVVTLACFASARLTPMIGDVGVRGLMKFIVFVLSFTLPTRLFYLAKRVISYRHLSAIHVLELALEFAQHVLAVIFFCHAIVMWIKQSFNVRVSGLFNNEFADLLLGTTGYLDSVVATLNGVRDAHGMGDQCDLIHLKQIVEDATADVVEGGKKTFSVDCSEWPTRGQLGSTWPKDPSDWGWDDLSADYDGDRKDISDQAICNVHCQNDFGTHDTLVKCTPAGLLGGRWSLEYQDVLQHRICIRHNATHPISVSYPASVDYNVSSPDSAESQEGSPDSAESQEGSPDSAEAQNHQSLSHAALAI